MIEVAISADLTYVRIDDKEYRSTIRPKFETGWPNQKGYLTLLYREHQIPEKTITDWYDGIFNWVLTKEQITAVRQFAETFDPNEAMEWPTVEMLDTQARMQREHRIRAVLDRINRYDNQVRFGQPCSDNEQTIRALGAELQQLRDITEQPTWPRDIKWPQAVS